VVDETGEGVQGVSIGDSLGPEVGEVIASPLRIEPDRGGLSGIEWDGGVRFSSKTAGEMGHRIRFESHPPHQENRSVLRKRDVRGGLREAFASDR
jgi:hypothetical protein